MPTAYVLVKIDTGREEEIFKKIKGFPEVKKANVTFGMCDIVIETAFENIEDLDNFLFSKLRKIPGVTETTSIISSKTIV